MSTVVAIDPGLTCAGLAVFVDEKLTFVEAIKTRTKGNQVVRAAAIAKAAIALAPEADVVVVEWPQIYQRDSGKTKGDPNNLLPLAAICGAVAALAWPADVIPIRPAAWKGQIPKTTKTGDNPIAARALARLSSDERALLSGRKLPHDVFDAIGLGLHWLGRFARKRVFPGAT